MSTLKAQITTALEQVRAARDQGEIEREWFWQGRMDYLLDMIAAMRPPACG